MPFATDFAYPNLLRAYCDYCDWSDLFDPAFQNLPSGWVEHVRPETVVLCDACVGVAEADEEYLAEQAEACGYADTDAMLDAAVQGAYDRALA